MPDPLYGQCANCGGSLTYGHICTNVGHKCEPMKPETQAALEDAVRYAMNTRRNRVMRIMREALTQRGRIVHDEGEGILMRTSELEEIWCYLQTHK